MKDPKRKDRQSVNPAEDEQQEPTWQDPGSLARDRQRQEEGDDDQEKTPEQVQRERAEQERPGQGF